MCDCVPSTLPTYHRCIKIPNTRFTRFPPKSPTSPLLSNHLCYSSATRPSNSGLQFISLRFESNGPKSTNSRSSGSGSEEREIYGELEFKPKQETRFEEQMLNNSSINNGRIDGLSYDEGGAFSGGDFLGNDEDSGTETSTTKGRLKDDDLVKIRGSDSDGGGLKIEELEKLNLRRGRQLMRRSNLIAKQVISLHSALTLGFVSQLWVDTNSWVVLIVEVRPSLLSGELERFLLEDISQVGDVVLIEDENVMENEFKMVGLETLVGYNVVTPGRRNIGKVRGFTFNINSGAVESLELDSFGISIIPSSLVSTYALFVEDVLEVVSDTVVVHEAAASRMQRLTKGFWNDQKVGNSIDELGEYSDLEREAVESEYGRGRKRRTGRRKSHPKMREIPDEWELPMDYL